MFDLLHLILTFFVGFSIAYYLFVWRNKAAPATQAALPPPTQVVTQPATAATTSPVPSTPSSPLPPQLSAPRIDISPASPTPVLKEDEVVPVQPATPSTVSAEPVAPVAANPVAAEQPSGGSVRRVKKSSGNALSTPSSPSGRSKLAVSSTAPPSSSKKAQSEDSVTPASSPFLRASAEETAANSAVQIGQRRQSRSLNAIPKAANTKEAIKKLSSKTPPPVLGAVEPSPSLSHLKGKKPGSAIGPRTTVPATPVNLADWRRTGVSASHSVLLGSGGGRDADGGSNGAAHDLAMEGSASQQQPRRKIVSSSELPKHELQKGGSHRGLFVPRRLRSSSSTARKNATRVYPYQFDELSADLAELKKAFAHPVTGVRTKTLTRKLTRKTYHHCFVGYDAVDWLLESVGGIDRRQAVNLGVRMWASGFFKHVGSKRPFSDGPNHFYIVVGHRDRKKRLSLKGSKRRRARRESVADLVMGEEKPIQDALKPREGWLDVKQGDTWTKHWCLVTEMRHIKARLDAHLGQVATGSGDADDEGKWTGWGLAIFEELVDKSLLDFVEEMTAAGTGIKIKARRHYLRNYGRCFAGSKAVDWCLANKKSASRQEAILAMTALLQKGLITHVDKEPVYKDTKHDYYKFNIPVGPGGGKEGEKEKKKEEKKEKKKKEKERRKEAREELGGDLSDGDAPAPPLGDITGGGGGKVATCPIAILPLSDCLIKLDKSGSYVEIVLYHNDNSRIFLSGWKPPSSLATTPSSGSGAASSSSADEAMTPGGGRRSWRGKGSAFDESASYFSIRIHRKDDAYVREWIFALEAAMLLGEMDQEGFTLDPTVVSDEDDEEDDEEDEDDEEVGEAAEGGYPAEAHGEAGEEVEEIITEEEEEEEEGGSDEAGETGDEEIDRSDEGESATEEESTERQEELMNSTEKIVLEEMRREIQQMEDRKRREAAAGGKPPAAPDDVDYSTVPDGELLKFLRARRLVVADAIVLMKSSVGYRRRNNLYDIKIADVMQEVGGCMLQLVEGALDKEGRVVLLVQPQHYTPAASPPLNVVRAVMYLLDKAQEDVEVQRKGFTVLVDGTGSKYSNFDPKMPRVLLDGIISRYPARIGYTIITNMPWFFRFVWAVIRPLLSEKLAQRFHIVTVDRLAEFIPPDRLLPTYGGTLNYDHRAWIRRQHEREGIPYSG